MTRGRASVCCNGMMAPSTEGSGKMVNKMELVWSAHWMEMFSIRNGQTEKKLGLSLNKSMNIKKVMPISNDFIIILKF